MVVIVLDDHNILQLDTNRYTGLGHVGANGWSAIEDYVLFFDLLTRFAQVVYGYSDCSDRFGMGSQLDIDCMALRQLSTDNGHIPRMGMPKCSHRRAGHELVAFGGLLRMRSAPVPVGQDEGACVFGESLFL